MIRATTTLTLLLLALATTPAAAKRDPANVIMPEDPERSAIHKEWGFSEAVIHNDTVYLSGWVAGPRPGETELPAIFDRAFRDMAAILKRAGSSWDDVLEITTYHTDLPAQIEAFRDVKARYVQAPFPAWTAIDVDRLAPDSGIVEIKVVAKR